MKINDENIDLSIVVPMYNEALSIDLFLKRLNTVLNNLNMRYEIICVNDGSKDETLARLAEHHRHNPLIKIINLSRNFGKDIALCAGIDHAKGKAVIPIDSDLQDPPELIKELVIKWGEGFDAVYATRRTRQGESWIKRTTAKIFYRILNHMTEISVPHDTGDFRLLDRRVIDALSMLRERTRFMKGIFSWVGFKQTAVMYDREKRYAGRTKWNYWRLWNFAIDGIISFSSMPLRVWSYIGLVISLASFVYAVLLISRTLIKGIDIPGYASLMVVILFLGGIQLISLGIIGEYIGRMYTEVKGRPLYLIRDSYGFNESKDK